MSTESLVGNSSEMQLVTFSLGSEDYAVDILTVQEIIRMTAITGIPNAPDFIEGIINLRGVVIPIVELRKRFGMQKAPVTGSTRIIVVKIGSAIVGLVVDQVSEVLRIARNAVDDAPAIVKGSINRDFIMGVGKLDDRLLILLDLDRMFRDDETADLDKVTDRQAA